jgi:hypothetical protein
MKWPFLGGREEVGKGLEGGKRGRGEHIMHYHLFEVVISCRPSSSLSSKAAQMAD